MFEMLELNKLSDYKYACIDKSIASRLFLSWYWDKCANVFFKIAPNMAPNTITLLVHWLSNHRDFYWFSSM